MRSYTVFFVIFSILGGCLHASVRSEHFKERSRSVVFVEYFTQREIDRQSSQCVGLVIDDDGLIVCLGNSFSDWLPPSRFKDIKVFPAKNPNGKGFSATYLGQDGLNGWHYLRIEDKEALQYLTSIRKFPVEEPEIGDNIWGVCLTTSELDYVAYYREAHLSITQPLPLMMGFADNDVSVPGAPVFSESGAFIGWTGMPFPEERDMWIGNDYFRASMRNPDESSAFLLAKPFLANVGKKMPETPSSSTRSWMGISGTQPLDKDTASFLGLENQGALVVSEVLPDTPADKAGLKDRDILVGLDGENLPRLKPDSIVQSWFELELRKRDPGDTIELDVLRGDKREDIKIALEKSPKSMKEASYNYFEAIGVNIREFLLGDAIQRRVDYREATGVVVSFIKPNSPAATGELQPGDWIQQINGKEIKTWDDAVSILQETIDRAQKEEIVFLVKRANETAVLRVRMD